jgi:cell fate regulator YaaT (PSP1 superfamily)
MNNAGDEHQLVGVKFQSAGKLYHFAAPLEMSLSADDWVVVETIYGEQLGQVAVLVDDPPGGLSYDQIKPVCRRATGLDMAKHQVGLKRAEKLWEAAKEEIAEMDLKFKVGSVEFSLDGKTALVIGTGNLSKKEHSDLRRRVANRMRCRVKLRSVGPRDYAKALGGYGVCGEPRCCSRFLTGFRRISIRMAKAQGVSMAPSDITGLCGRLRCCLAYEHEVYKEASKGLPKLKARVQTEHGLGRVIDRDILKGELTVEIPPDGPRYKRERYHFMPDEVEVVKRKK